MILTDLRVFTTANNIATSDATITLIKEVIVEPLKNQVTLPRSVEPDSSF